MRAFWVYDWEVYKNFACVTFIHTTTPKVYIDAYIKLDIEYLQVRNKLELNLRTDDWNELEDYVIWEPFENTIPINVVDNMKNLYDEISYLLKNHDIVIG